eukprot:TRINITY_DN67039_c4_g1_i2.p1 TRINITY_DN67039_c4_g1~~TRINITY_DN67039_c4_g1_i2.p1  ORF type:complete len:684 (-),score=107.07 TRINITY_DN67039_c4_g1_i2:89-2101(-)
MPDGGDEQQQQQPGLLQRMTMPLLVFFTMQYFFGNKQQAPSKVSGGDKQVAKVDPPCSNMFTKGEHLEFSMYVTHNKEWDFQNSSARKLIWKEKSVYFDSTIIQPNRKANFTYTVDDYLVNNGSLYAHIWVYKYGAFKPSDPDYDDTAVVHHVHSLIKWRPKPVVKKTKNLLTGETERENDEEEQPAEGASESNTAGQQQEEEEQKEQTGASESEVEEESEDDEFEGYDFDSAVAKPQQQSVQELSKLWVPFWKPTLDLTMVDDWNVYSRQGLPPQLEALKFHPTLPKYYPVIYVNEFWTLGTQLTAINRTLLGEELTVEMGQYFQSLFKWQLTVQMQQSFQMQADLGMTAGDPMSATGGDPMDEMKRMLLETNPALLGLTMVVSILHTVFDMLAFRSEIKFWKSRSDLTGLSLRALSINTGCQVVIFLYLLDHETSWMILLSAGLGCGIEFWKLLKMLDVTWKKLGPVPYPTFKSKVAYAESETNEFDNQAMKYLWPVIGPCVIGYSIYSVMYNEHKSWYSFVLQTAVGCVYAFGFILMTPQLFINYKLKSVAHLNGKLFMYKALNTVIDDLFAFIITMPTLHRLSCFRDDLVFVIYLYQRWKYPVDPTRVNEFGVRGDGKTQDDVEREEKEKEEAKKELENKETTTTIEAEPQEEAEQEKEKEKEKVQ